MTKIEIEKALKEVTENYLWVWKIADKEKREEGKVSYKTRNRLDELEDELCLLEMM